MPSFYQLRKQKKVLFLALILTCLPGAKIYKWVDENGKKHFSSTPPKGMESQDMTGNYRSGSSSDSKGTTETPSGNGSIEDKWYAKGYNSLIELSLKNGSYQWNVHRADFSKEQNKGKYSLETRKIILTDSKKVEQTLYIKKRSRYQLVLTDPKIGKKYEFQRAKDERYNLSPKEQKVSGQWAQVHPQIPDQIVGVVEFEGGQFSRYTAQGKFTGQRLYKGTLLAEGTWKIQSAAMVLEYTPAYGQLMSKALKKEYWTIDKLDQRNLVLVQRGTTKKIHLRKERTR